ncbi:hypothetical protein MOD31_18530 [Paenarthrobacter sp. TYUT067]|uniref:hypothetical protein n=1 Tax=Paenarthrobacter sp. TYUT067 TaxID=2926245 RepID=UPI0020307E73|nr:hypothetical protein [Paenarthrobacter sp. TYUT067]MCM0618024.1 hypothetical protein [Paenarthrobacter sp. TYUT067]
MEPEQYSRPVNDHTTSSEPAAKAAKEQKRIRFSAWIGIGLAIFIMVPALYRLATEPPRWADAIFVSVGVGLIIFHTVRVIRLRRG